MHTLYTPKEGQLILISCCKTINKWKTKNTWTINRLLTIKILIITAMGNNNYRSVVKTSQLLIMIFYNMLTIRCNSNSIINSILVDDCRIQMSTNPITH